MYQKESKLSARNDPVFKTKEIESKRSARRHSPFKTYEIVYQKASRKRLRIKVTPDLHLTYSKNGGNLGLVLKMKK